MNKTLLLTAQLLCCALAVMYLAKSSDYSIQITFSGVLLIGSVLCLTHRFYAMLLLPSVVILGPVVRMGLADRVDVTAADLYILILTAAYYASTIRSSTSSRRYDEFDVLAFLMVMLCAVGMILSDNLKSSMVSFIGIIQYFLIFKITRDHITNERTANSLLIFWVLAVCLGSFMVIYAYITGIPLLLEADRSAGHERSAWSNTRFLFRPTFFVAGFIFPLAAAMMAIVGLWVSSTPKKARYHEGTLLFAMVPIIACVIVMANKTVYASILISGILYYLIRYKSFNDRIRRVMGIALFIYICGYAGFVLIPDFAQEMWVSTVTNTNTLSIRISMWPRVVEYLLDSPKVLFLGLGPDFTVRNAMSSMYDDILVSSTGREGAVDNTYLYLIMDYGLIFFVFGMFFFYRVISQMMSKDRSGGRGIREALLLIFLVWVIMGATQQCAVMKPALFLIQAIAIAANIGTRGILRASPTVVEKTIDNSTFNPKISWRRR